MFPKKLVASGLALALAFTVPAVTQADPSDFQEIRLSLESEAQGTRLSVSVLANLTVRTERTGEWNAAPPVSGKLTKEEGEALLRAFRGALVPSLPPEIKGAGDPTRETRLTLETWIGSEKRTVSALRDRFVDAASGVDYGERLRPLMKVLLEAELRLGKGQSREVVGGVGVETEPLFWFLKKTTVDVLEFRPQVYSEVVIANQPWKKILEGENMTTVHLYGKVKSVKNHAGIWRSELEVAWAKASAREDLLVTLADGTPRALTKGSFFKVTGGQDGKLSVQLANGEKGSVAQAKVSLGRRLSEVSAPATTPATTTGIVGGVSNP